MEEQAQVSCYKINKNYFVNYKVRLRLIKVPFNFAIIQGKENGLTYTMQKTDTKDLKEKDLKRNVLRYNEYYNMQPTFDLLYKQSKEGSSFKHLYSIIASRENILLAYRKIKRNKGSKTAGTNGHKIKDWEMKDIEEYVSYIQSRLENYIPQPVRRVEIPKSDGKTRPLGIPCIEDRLIQQAIKQVLEPICEAKFFEHSYGFRPNRGTEHAIAYAVKKVNIDKCYYVVDIDIKGFFDNVNHEKLLKQLWTIGIHDKKVLSIIGTMLKSEIKDIGIPDKGTPQGGILSPLLANVVLNELDWWIASQWQEMKTRHCYNCISNKYRHMRKSRLKEIYLVRYADDFKIFCKKKSDATKIYHATQQWLKERLSLDISPEKSQVIDIRKHSSEFLGLSFKAFKKKKKWIIQSHITEKAKTNVIESIKNQVKKIKKNQKFYEVLQYNRIIAGVHDSYKIATNVTKDFKEISYKLLDCLKNQLKNLKSTTGYKTREYNEKYKGFGGKEIYVLQLITYPISYIQTKAPKLFNQIVCNYTSEGRILVHKNLQNVNEELLKYLLDNPIGGSVELNDNRIALYSGQGGRCVISNRILQENMETHHILPKSKGGTDKYKNLVLVLPEVHKLIHATVKSTIQYYLNLLKLSNKAIQKVNKYRLSVGNEMIMSE